MIREDKSKHAYFAYFGVSCLILTIEHINAYFVIFAVKEIYLSFQMFNMIEIRILNI